jgi:Uncharacterised nucleotidyltransferase
VNKLLSFRETALRFLTTDSLELLRGFDEEAWERNLRWLDRSGLALPLAARLAGRWSDSAVPDSIRAALQSRLLDNQKRMERMLEFFDQVVSALSAARVRYCCVKGFSLIPDCFHGMRERHQVDLDFLVDPSTLNAAVGAIEGVGYKLQYASSSGEVRLITPWKKHIGVGEYLYQLPEGPPVELHSRFWEADSDGIEFPLLPIFPDSTEAHELYSIDFPRLSPAYQFLYLLLHIFRHLLGSWMRLLSLYEVATFIRTRGSCDEIWAEVVGIIERDQRLSTACALVLGLVELAFPVELPEKLHEVYSVNLSLDSALWLDRCAAMWLLADPPGNKLNLLVQKQFWADRDIWKQYLVRRLLPIRSPHKLSDEAVSATRKALRYRVEEIGYQISRMWYHVKSDVSYLNARVRWNRRKGHDNRSAYRIAAGL